jgi:outer membrane lipoprotein SlyB
MIELARLALAVGVALMIAGCNSADKSSIKFLSGSQTSSSNAAQPQPVRMLSAEEIRTTLVGKNWQYTRSESSGFVTYNTDGSLTYQDDVKGEGRGTWSAVEGQLCQSLAGQPTECSEFKSTGDAYHAGKMRLVGI